MLRYYLFVVIMSLVLPIANTASANDLSKSINLAGKQRMLTQKMSKEAILVALDVDKITNLENLKKSHDLFAKTLKGLEHGDDELQFAAMKKPKITKQLKKVQKLWEPFSAKIVEIYDSGMVTDEQVSYIATHNLPLLKEMNKAVKFFETAAAGSNVNPALAKAINISGRQRMLTQKMSKEFFLVAYGYEKAENQMKLGETTALFEGSLNSLINGNNSMGLPAAPTPELKKQLELVQNMWGDYKEAMELGVNDASVEVISEINLPILKEMNKAVGMYEAL